MSVGLEMQTPKEIVSELDRYIIGQDKAKKAVAIALRNRLRRSRLPDDLRDEIAPKNIIMIGPTGVGKTEIARRLSKLCKAPFIKVEATKFTEVGYVGRDVESMVRDLMASAVSMVKTELKEGVQEEARMAAEEALLDLLLPGSKVQNPVPDNQGNLPDIIPEPPGAHTREVLRRKLRDGELEDKMVEVKISGGGGPSIEIFSGSNFESMDMKMGALGNIFGGMNKKSRKVKVSQAREILLGEQTDKLIDSDNAMDMARDRVQNMGMIFIDEIDKIANSNAKAGGQDVSREGVQRDILPIVEGCTVNTKYGMIDTSHILFIAAGAFNLSKPSDLIPELQGRFPIRVELEDLNADAFEMILTQPKTALIKQYKELLGTEEVTLTFTDDAIRRLAELAEEVNNRTENIGARRLYTIMELLLEDVSFNAPDLKGQTIDITPAYVDDRLGDVIQDRDLSRYIL
ncbi:MULTISPECIES: ATP-dependent protease ATPase subunit HslU [unclassified Oceanispirochaeta]|uniref:ATP-dependent protease ATPase subunit HslU n=1 Tax=unclassified Oceanispirochaeta TaxID=2635722 RepID=UPI000E090053|nr:MULTISPECIES: ATP-dependent protease ATPase subunit HslU [unclassified Oceanispirochaeta]MBF9016146.1 ATP-dependent protease ATPase subunit HslU [Oceanispirochaeta sp. M2]NPD72608.1 ATP-dependent protease ATPase subunit HslU [Oceanispirochaeta sp. M1]RDG31760.1 ATP-dependent protease ATPase subunit HslU [Oceanispirochaeta sp. M1]